MTQKTLKADLAVIGAGSGGLSVAAGAAQLGLNVVLFEKGEMGGDCLNTGCVPSKALLTAGKYAHAMRIADRFGLKAVAPEVDWPAVKAHIAGVIAAIAPIDSQERFEGLGCTVVREHARFTGPKTVASASVSVTARRIVIAAGARALAPNIPGLTETPFHTNETIFEAPEFPARLIIIGAGAIGIELGQAFRRLGAEVTILEAAAPLARLDPDAAAAALSALKAEGVAIRAPAKVVRTEAIAGGVRVHLEGGEAVEGSHLLLAIGRRVNVDGLDLEKANVAYTPRGITVDAYLRSTTNRRVFAVGDIAGREQFTHAAGWHASALVRTMLFKAATRADAVAIPQAVYCDPEIAQIGLTEAEAAAQFGAKAKTLRWSFHENDRAQAERDTEGFAKLTLGPGGKVVGAVVVGPGAADIIQQVSLAISAKLGVRALTGPVAPYPTRGEIIKRAAGANYTPVLFSPGTRRLVSLLQRLG